eukprot:scaffold167080_cov30-Tisochrysis_lutea.AAC.3
MAHALGLRSTNGERRGGKPMVMGWPRRGRASEPGVPVGEVWVSSMQYPPVGAHHARCEK